MKVVVLQKSDGSEPFTNWLAGLRDREARARILARLTTVRRGSLGTTRALGGGVSEIKINYGPGYRLYFGRKGEAVVLLIVGGDKTSQKTDIEQAKVFWEEYKDEIENG